MGTGLNGLSRMSGAAVALVLLFGGATSAWGAIEEIVVTSRKVEESLKDVPLSITAFSSSMIEDMGITNLQDVADFTPGLSFFNAFGENLPVPIIRGVAQTDIFGETNAGIFVDGVYVAGREGLNFSQLDIERIEVVKGPQSAQYGRTAFSGAINYITKRPKDVFESKIDVEAGNRGKQKVSALVSGPIFGDWLRGRVAALYDDWDGSYNNSDHPEVEIGGHRFRSFQGSLVSNPTNNLEIYGSVYLSNDEIDDAAVIGIVANCENRVDDDMSDVRFNNFCGRIPDLDQVPSPGTGLIDQDSMPKVARALGEDRDLLRANLNVRLDFDFGEFTSLTAFSDTEQQSLSDFGHLGDHIPYLYCAGAAIENPGSPNSCGPNAADNLFFSGVLDEERGAEVEEISQEIRFTSPQDRAIRYTVGGYYYSSELDSYDGGIVNQAMLPAADIGFPPFDPSAPNFAIGTAIFYCGFTDDGCLDPLNRVRLEEDTDSWAVFGGLDIDFNDRLTGRAELRYTHQSLQVRSLDYTRCSPTGLDPDCGDDWYDLRELDPNVTASSARFSEVTGRIGLDLRVNDNWMVYSSIATGDKPGGLEIDTSNVITPTGTELEVIPNSWETEKLVAYEVGLKGRTEDGRISLDASLFLLDWSDIVLRQLVENSPISGRPLEQPTGFRFNAGTAEVFGWEMTTDIGFTDNLRGRLTVNWNDAELTEASQDTFESWPTFAPDGDVAGNKLLRQPEWMGSASLDYARSLWGSWEGFARIDATYQDKVFIGNDNQSWLPARTTANLRFGVESERITVAFWMRNMFNNDDAVAAFRDIFWSNTDSITPPFVDQGPRPTFDKFVPIRYTVTYPRLRTFGVNATVRFGGD